MTKTEKVSNTQKRLRELMEKFNVNQVDIVNKSGIPKSALSQYVNGIREPRQDKLTMIADAFNISEVWLMGYDVAMERKKQVDGFKDVAENFNRTHSQQMLNPIENRLIKYSRTLNEVGKRKIIESAMEMSCNPLYNDNYEEALLAAHEKPGATDEEKQHDYDLMNDENF